METQPSPAQGGPGSRGEPVDLGVIQAYPVDPEAQQAPQAPRGPQVAVVVGRIREGTATMVSDIRAARRGPVPNSRPVPEWVRSLAWFLDESVPIGGDRRVGVEGIVGLIPGIGDAAGLVASMVVVLAGVAAGVSLPTLTLMLVHVGIDTIVGVVPFLGAVFDLAYKANTRNLKLIERDLSDRAGTRRSVLRVFALSFVALAAGWVLFLIALIGGTYLFVRLVSGWF